MSACKCGKDHGGTAQLPLYEVVIEARYADDRQQERVQWQHASSAEGAAQKAVAQLDLDWGIAEKGDNVRVAVVLSDGAREVFLVECQMEAHYTAEREPDAELCPRCRNDEIRTRTCTCEPEALCPGA